MAGAWINHVKATHKKLGGSYKDAMKAAAKTWKSKAKTTKYVKLFYEVGVNFQSHT